METLVKEDVRGAFIIKKREQAGTELGQAQLKLDFDFTLIFFRFGLIVSGSLWIASD